MRLLRSNRFELRAVWFGNQAAEGPAMPVPPTRPPTKGQCRLHFKVVAVFDLWDLQGHWSSILEPLTSNLWAIFMTSKHCPLIELIGIAAGLWEKGHRLPRAWFAALHCYCCWLFPLLFPRQHKVCVETECRWSHTHLEHTGTWTHGHTRTHGHILAAIQLLKTSCLS